MLSTKLKASEQRQQQCEDLRRLLASEDMGALLDLFDAQAVQFFGGRFTVLSLSTFYKAAFGTPGFDVDGRGDVEDLPASSTLKDAVIDALVAVRTFYQDADRDGIRRGLLERIQEATD
jgi:hypothetical protein